MNGRCLRSNNNFSSIGEDPTECVVNMSIQQFVLGDIIWCKINGQSWWPGQVVDEKFVASKPKKRKKDQFLVRLYGTFEHMYVEPVNCVPKNEKINGQNNCTNREIFEKALKEELSRMKSGGQSETKNSESNENAKEIDEALKGKGQGKGQRKGKLKRTNNEDNFPNKCHIPEKNGELSPRQARVMQNLGLIAPSGSPFRRNGLMIKPLLPEISQLPSPMSD